MTLIFLSRLLNRPTSLKPLFNLPVIRKTLYSVCPLSFPWIHHDSVGNMGFGSPILAIILMAFLLLSNNSVTANPEVNVLHAFRQSLHDPANVLHSWDPNLVNPCTWVHVTCDSNNSVVRLDLGNAQLSGPLLPELSHLRNLQYLELFKNSFNGSIPSTWGSFENLISLDLYMNNLDGEIPATLGDLSTLVFLRLNNNQLKGHIPKTLTKLQSLSVIDLSYNNLTGEVPPEGSFSKFTSASFKGNQLCGEIVDTPCPLSHVSSGTQS